MAKPPKKKGKPDELLVAQNRAASYNYHLLEKLEAGMVLLGTEVKSLREGKANLRDAYAVIQAGAVWLLNCHIGEYLPGGPAESFTSASTEAPFKERGDRKARSKDRSEGANTCASADLLPGWHCQVRDRPGAGKEKWDRRQTERDKEAKREVGEAMYKFRHR